MNEQKEETKRDRVRRLLITPLVDPIVGLGMRRNKKIMDEDRFKTTLDRLCDELGYMSDLGLETLFGFLKYKGEGPNRDILPVRATFLAYAELVEACPIERIPAMRSWFASVEGPKAKLNGTLVETYRFIRTFKRPPSDPKAQDRIQVKAVENQRELEHARGMIARGRNVGDHQRFIDTYEADRAAAQALLSAQTEQVAS